MRNHHSPRNLRRIFGSQTVVSVGSPACPEEGIVDQLIPAQSSGWTFHGQGDVHCRPADLPTCRPADLPTCRPADLPTCRPADLPTCRPADLPTIAGLPEITLLGLGGIEVAFLDGIHGIGKNTPVQNLAEFGNGRRNV
jgi:hypothetical protein